ncbi:hypothetical protein ABPG75_007589 [Micractinium tetrahymenae]
MDASLALLKCRAQPGVTREHIEDTLGLSADEEGYWFDDYGIQHEAVEEALLDAVYLNKGFDAWKRLRWQSVSVRAGLCCLVDAPSFARWPADAGQASGGLCCVTLPQSMQFDGAGSLASSLPHPCPAPLLPRRRPGSLLWRALHPRWARFRWMRAPSWRTRAATGTAGLTGCSMTTTTMRRRRTSS